jgi:hypothetical protein
MQIALLASYFMLLSFFIHSSIPKREATWSQNISVDFQQITWNYIPKDRNIHHSTSFQLFIKLAYCSNVNVAVDDHFNITLFKNQNETNFLWMLEIPNIIVRFEVLTVVVMNVAIFWDIALRSLYVN